MTSPVFRAMTGVSGVDRGPADGEHIAMPERNDTRAPAPPGDGRQAADRQRDRGERLASALRENLRRRKAQARARSAGDQPAADNRRPGGKAPVGPAD